MKLKRNIRSTESTDLHLSTTNTSASLVGMFVGVKYLKIFSSRINMEGHTDCLAQFSLLHETTKSRMNVGSVGNVPCGS